MEHDDGLTWAQYTVSTLLVVVSSQHLTLTNTCLVIMMENRKFFFNAIVLNRRANIFNERKYFSVISMLLIACSAAGSRWGTTESRGRQEAAGGGQLEKLEAAKAA